MPTIEAAAEPRGYPWVSMSAIVSVTHGGPEGVRRLRIVNAQDVALTSECEECGELWLPGDPGRWRAELIDEGPEDRLAFWCAYYWRHEFGT
jgi:hypothetical protein